MIVSNRRVVPNAEARATLAEMSRELPAACAGHGVAPVSRIQGAMLPAWTSDGGAEGEDVTDTHTLVAVWVSASQEVVVPTTDAPEEESVAASDAADAEALAQARRQLEEQREHRRAVLVSVLPADQQDLVPVALLAWTATGGYPLDPEPFATHVPEELKDRTADDDQARVAAVMAYLRDLYPETSLATILESLAGMAGAQEQQQATEAAAEVRRVATPRPIQTF